MAKGKRGPNLFDLLYADDESNAESLKVPGWWSGRQTSKLKGQSARPERIDQPSKPSLTAPAKAKAPDESTQQIGFFRIEGPWIRLSFTSVSAAIVVASTLVVLLGCFEWGSRVGYDEGLAIGHKLGQESISPHAIDELELARAQPANTDLIGPLLKVSGGAVRVGAASQAADQAKTPWVRGLTYIVLQEFLPDRVDDATGAWEYLRQQGISSEIVKIARGGVQLISTQGYNHRDPAQKKLAEKLLRKIHAAGQAYFAEGGGYRLEGYYKLLKEDTW